MSQPIRTTVQTEIRQILKSINSPVNKKRRGTPRLTLEGESELCGVLQPGDGGCGKRQNPGGRTSLCQGPSRVVMGMTVLRNSGRDLLVSYRKICPCKVVCLSGQLVDTLLCSTFFYRLSSSLERIIKEQCVRSPMVPFSGRRLETRRRSKAFMSALSEITPLLKKFKTQLGQPKMTFLLNFIEN